MSAIRGTAAVIFREILRLPSRSIPSHRIFMFNPFLSSFLTAPRRDITFCHFRCLASSSSSTSGGEKVPSRLSQIKNLLQQAEETACSARNEITPKITLEHVAVSFARSGGPGGQNVNKVNTKVDMRFNVRNAFWLSSRIRERIIQMEKNRVNKDGDLVISSTKGRTQRGNIEDALGKLQAIIDAAAYVPPPPSEDKMKKIAKLSAAGERKRLDCKKAHSQKKALRRSLGDWD